MHTMGSRLRGIRRRSVWQLVESNEQQQLLKPHQAPNSTSPQLGLHPSSSPFYRAYRPWHAEALPTLGDQILHRDKKADELTLQEFRNSGFRISSRSLYIQDHTIWRQSEVLGKELKPWGEGPERRRWLATYSRVTEEAARVSTASTAVRYIEDDEDRSRDKLKDKEKEKDPSPEDCDEAVEDLSSVKAKHKQSQEAPKESTKKPSDGWMVKIRNVIFGIGPALRAIAAMSRYIFIFSLQNGHLIRFYLYDGYLL